MVRLFAELLQPTTPFAVTVTGPSSTAVVLVGVTLIELVVVVKLVALQPGGKDQVYVVDPADATQV